jgi:lysine 2,3-aminomutase
MKRTPGTITSLAGLAAAGFIGVDEAERLEAVADRFAIGVSGEMAGLIQQGSAGIARQFLPDVRELDVKPAEHADPIGDDAHSPVAGVVHRHPDRVLLKLLKVCPVYCRFCFRREMIGPGEDAVLSADAVDGALHYIGSRPEIWEVILTGGDPLMLSPRRIGEVVAQLAAIPHVKVLRWHTRVPCVAPGRVTSELVEALTGTSQTVYLALHANHPDELSEDCRSACRRLSDAGVRLVSQSVLLKGVNDELDVLAALMYRFVEFGVTPYYLHHPDLAPGTSHFRLPISRGLEIVQGLRRSLSGLCQPTYVLDLPGGYAKVPLISADVRRVAPGVYEIDDGRGRIHRYEDVLGVDA